MNQVKCKRGEQQFYMRFNILTDIIIRNYLPRDSCVNTVPYPCSAGSSSDGMHVLLLLLCGKFTGHVSTRVVLICGKGVWAQKKVRTFV